jgi:hypothetical protein
LPKYCLLGYRIFPTFKFSLELLTRLPRPETPI